MDENSSIVELIDEDGNSLPFEYLMTLDYREKEYVILSPLEPADNNVQELDGDEIVILRVEQDENDDDIYVSIEDEAELDDVFYAFNEIIAQDE